MRIFFFARATVLLNEVSIEHEYPYYFKSWCTTMCSFNVNCCFRVCCLRKLVCWSRCWCVIMVLLLLLLYLLRTCGNTLSFTCLLTINCWSVLPSFPDKITFPLSSLGRNSFFAALEVSCLNVWKVCSHVSYQPIEEYQW